MTTIKRRTDVVTIYGGDYLARIRHLEAQALAAAEAEDGAPKRVGSVSEARRLAQEHDALVAEAEKTATHITLQALRRPDWKDLVAEHPPREENLSDKAVGVNEDTFKEALVPRSIIDPADFSEDDLAELSDYDYDRLYYTAFALNRAGGDPKAGLVSRLTQSSDETSN